jgi:hypothetical protein
MSHQFERGGEHKNRLKPATERLKTGSQKSDQAIDTFVDDVDPADFFVPEEFGIRRRDVTSREP